MDNNTLNGSDLSAMTNVEWKATPTVTQTVLFFTLAAITVSGNGLVVIAVGKDPFRELRTIPNYLVVNLAIADLLLGLIAEPLWGMALWVHSAHYEIAALSVILISNMATNLTVVALSVERYLVLRSGVRYKTTVTHQRLSGCIGAIWLVSIVTALLPVMGWRHLPSYLLFITNGIHIPSFIVMVVMYILIFRILKLTKTSSFGNNQAVVNARLREKKVAKTVFVVLVVYALCWIPVWVSGNIAFTCGSKCISQKTNNFINLLGLINGFTNPIIYTFKMPKFRAAASFLLRCRCLCNHQRVHAGRQGDSNGAK